MTKLTVCAALAATLFTSLAHADDGSSPSDGARSEHTALALSLGGTAASIAVTAVGFSTDNHALGVVGLGSTLLTPSLGEWYAGKPLTIGMGIRAASTVAFLAGVAGTCTDVPCENHFDSAASYLMVGGLAGMAGGALYDIVTAKAAAREYNAKHGYTLTVAPTAVRTANGQSTMAIGISGTF